MNGGRMRKSRMLKDGFLWGIVLQGSLGGHFRNKSDKHFEMFKLMNQWLVNKQQGKELVTYFKDNRYKTVAIYGMSYVGERLYDDLSNTDVKVVYAIDKCADKVYADLEIYTLEDELPQADVIIVTAITYYNEIVEELLKVTDIPLISLEDIIYGL